MANKKNTHHSKYKKVSNDGNKANNPDVVWVHCYCGLYLVIHEGTPPTMYPKRSGSETHKDLRLIIQPFLCLVLKSNVCLRIFRHNCAKGLIK